MGFHHVLALKQLLAGTVNKVLGDKFNRDILEIIFLIVGENICCNPSLELPSYLEQCKIIELCISFD